MYDTRSTFYTVYITSMESTHHSNPSDGESERSPPSDAPLESEGFSLTPMDASVLTVYIEQFKSGDTETRNKTLEKAMGELYALRPPNSAFNKKEAKRVPYLVFRRLNADMR
jgi:hypothetical protein